MPRDVHEAVLNKMRAVLTTEREERNRLLDNYATVRAECDEIQQQHIALRDDFVRIDAALKAAPRQPASTVPTSPSSTNHHRALREQLNEALTTIRQLKQDAMTRRKTITPLDRALQVSHHVAFDMDGASATLVDPVTVLHATIRNLPPGRVTLGPDTTIDRTVLLRAIEAYQITQTAPPRKTPPMIFGQPVVPINEPFSIGSKADEAIDVGRALFEARADDARAALDAFHVASDRQAQETLGERLVADTAIGESPTTMSPEAVAPEMVEQDLSVLSSNKWWETPSADEERRIAAWLRRQGAARLRVQGPLDVVYVDADTLLGMTTPIDGTYESQREHPWTPTRQQQKWLSSDVALDVWVGPRGCGVTTALQQWCLQIARASGAGARIVLLVTSHRSVADASSKLLTCAEGSATWSIDKQILTLDNGTQILIRSSLSWSPEHFQRFRAIAVDDLLQHADCSTLPGRMQRRLGSDGRLRLGFTT